jgi:hypothetical protein
VFRPHGNTVAAGRQAFHFPGRRIDERFAREGSYFLGWPGLRLFGLPSWARQGAASGVTPAGIKVRKVVFCVSGSRLITENGRFTYTGAAVPWRSGTVFLVVLGGVLARSGSFWVFWVDLLWVVLGDPWLFWVVLGRSGWRSGSMCSRSFWVVLGCSGSSVVLNRSGSFWVVLGCPGSFWVVLARSAFFLVVLGRSRSFCVVLGRFGSFWVKAPVESISHSESVLGPFWLRSGCVLGHFASF